ncbi:RsmB/NOP family class I SAM-dependent RNA methyltransferase [Paracoccus sp. NSM]|uniref:RsmB/NOP family class I SAM-dependent RNA methyltransferase n=1 Tax=Paracoccus sp. NSM TaxID=3457784 RepID=UPI0040352144
MTPGARIAAAIEVLDQILAGDPAEAALLRWSRASRFAGSGDRAALRDLVFGALRQRNTLAALGGALTGRGLMIGMARAEGRDPQALFTGTGHAPAPLTEAEAAHSPPPLAPLADLPDWLHPAWRASLGDRAEAVAAAMGQRAPVWLRANLARGGRDAAVAALAEDGISALPGEGASSLRVTQGERRVAASRAYRDGLVELQDLSPQLACEDLPLAPKTRVLDYCAGGGGKVLALAARQPDALFFAHDAAPQRLKDLPARAVRAGARVSILPRVTGVFDLVVADVPCSGSGTWRRSPDARWRFAPQDLAGLRATQAQILRDVAGMVAPGGHLAYMTCSLLAEENDSQINGFLPEHRQFSLLRRQVWTPIEAGDGFFLAVLRREGG